ncbi:SDR family oxidoreductase [Caenimonas soli]|uniref:SDR family oxidoreductase n=1 Tax=Caenimonas soli TaxID=2735555 RepID=UPI001557B806|nr:SDR family oxidoreductase [Caenimonas soli]NPC59404.1 SDR family oxidoreductase [Caenimonas soli]
MNRSTSVSAESSLGRKTAWTASPLQKLSAKGDSFAVTVQCASSTIYANSLGKGLFMTTVLITGANRGVGLALVKEYATGGDQVIATCREPAKADALNSFAMASNGRVRILPLEIADEVSIASLKRVLADEPIDIIINNAAINGTPKEQTYLRIDGENYIHAVRVNALGPMLLSQALFANLRRGTAKRLVAITSSYGSIGRDWDRTVTAHERYAYRASKAALNMGMRSLSRDWAEFGVIVGIIEPGWVRTDMGGKSALETATSISAEESARGMKDCISKLTPETSGIFQRFWGEVLPW